MVRTPWMSCSSESVGPRPKNRSSDKSIIQRYIRSAGRRYAFHYLAIAGLNERFAQHTMDVRLGHSCLDSSVVMTRDAGVTDRRGEGHALDHAERVARCKPRRSYWDRD